MDMVSVLRSLLQNARESVITNTSFQEPNRLAHMDDNRAGRPLSPLVFDPQDQFIEGTVTLIYFYIAELVGNLSFDEIEERYGIKAFVTKDNHTSHADVNLECNQIASKIVRDSQPSVNV